MRTVRAILGPVTAVIAAAGLLVVGCSSSSSNNGGGTGGSAGSSGGSAGMAGSAGTAGGGGTAGTAGSGGTAGMDGGAGAAGSGGMAGSGGAGGSGVVDAGPTMTVSGVVTDSSTDNPLPSVKVCVTYPNIGQVCTNTNSSGQYSLAGVPQSQDVTLSYELTAYVPADLYTHTGTADTQIPVQLITTATLSGFAALLGKQIDTSKGLVFTNALTLTDAGTPTPKSGVSFALSPTSGDGPVYLDASGAPNASLTATSSKGIAAVLNVAPASYDLSVTTSNCAGPNSGWSPAANKVSLKVTAGRASLVGFLCQ